MRLMRKCAAILAAFGIVMTGTVVHAVPEEVQLSETESYQKLSAFGILNGDAFEDGYVTRETFVKYILKTFRIDTLSGENDPFSDNTGMFQAEMITAYSYGLIDGSAEQVCSPTELIDGGAAAKIIMNAMNYGARCELSGGYPTGYLLTAKQLGIFDGCGSMAEGITGETLLKIMVNILETDALNIDRIKIGNGQNTVEYSVTKSDKLLGTLYDIYEVKGIVEANEFTSVYGETFTDEDEIAIDDVKYFAKGFDTCELLGAEIDAYYRYDEKTDTRTLLYWKYGKNTKILDLMYYDVDEITESELRYAFGNKTKSIRTANASLIYNGRQAPLKRETLEHLYGSVSVVDNNGDGSAEVLKVWDYRSVLVSGKSTASYTVLDKQGGEPLVLDPNDGNYQVIMKYEDGTELNFALIAVDNLISYAQSLDGELKFLTVSTKTAEGKVTTVKKEHISVEGTEYRAKQEIADTVSLGGNSVFYIDFMGIIAAKKENKDVTYGFLYGANNDHFDDVKFLIYSENGNWVTLHTTKKILHNGVTVKASDFVKTYCNKPEEYRQLVRYRVNAAGELAEIDYAEKYNKWSSEENKAIEENTFRISDSYASATYRSSPMTFENALAIDDSTAIFMIPADMNREEFYINNRSWLIPDETYKEVTSYDADRGGLTRICTIKYKFSAINEKAGFMIVEDIGTMLDTNGEEVDCVIGWYGGVGGVTFALKDCPDVTDAEVKSGDVILIAFDGNNKVANIGKLYDSGNGWEQKFLLKGISPTTTPYGTSQKIAGKVMYSDSINKRLAIDWGVDNYLMLGLGSVTSVYIMDTKNQTVSRGSIADIQKGSYIFGSINYYRLQEIVIFE